MPHPAHWWGSTRHHAHPLLSFPAHPKTPARAPLPPEPPDGAGTYSTLLVVPVGKQMKLLLFGERSLELNCRRGLDTPALPGDVRGGRRGASGRQAETVAGQRGNTHTITGGPAVPQAAPGRPRCRTACAGPASPGP